MTERDLEFYRGVADERDRLRKSLAAILEAAELHDIDAVHALAFKALNG